MQVSMELYKQIMMEKEHPFQKVVHVQVREHIPFKK